jgi:hypothetical protein
MIRLLSHLQPIFFLICRSAACPNIIRSAVKKAQILMDAERPLVVSRGAADEDN